MDWSGLFLRFHRRAFHIYARFARPMTLGVRAAVLDSAGRVLLVRHGYVPGWHLPGGGVEAGETLAAALVKELREEAMIEPEGAPALHGVFYNDLYSRRDHVAVYVVRNFRRLGVRKPDFEIREAAFFPLDALPEGTSASTRARLDEIARALPAPDRW